MVIDGNLTNDELIDQMFTFTIHLKDDPLFNPMENLYAFTLEFFRGYSEYVTPDTGTYTGSLRDFNCVMEQLSQQPGAELRRDFADIEPFLDGSGLGCSEL